MSNQENSSVAIWLAVIILTAVVVWLVVQFEEQKKQIKELKKSVEVIGCRFYGREPGPGIIRRIILIERKIVGLELLICSRKRRK